MSVVGAERRGSLILVVIDEDGSGAGAAKAALIRWGGTEDPNPPSDLRICEECVTRIQSAAAAATAATSLSQARRDATCSTMRLQVVVYMT